MQWLKWVSRTGPLIPGREALAKRAARIARSAVHIVALAVVLDAALRLIVGRRDLVGFGLVGAFLCSAVVAGLAVHARESRLGLRAHVDEVALALAALIIEYFALATVAAKLW
jgi:hypothetical protein